MERLRRQGLKGCLRVQMPLRGGRGGGCMVPLVSLTRLTLSGESLVRYSATDCSG